MSSDVTTVTVSSHEELQHAINSYIAQGFMVSTQTPTSVTMFKPKKFEVLWAVIGFFLCLLPLLIYCIVYATQKDQMVVIQIWDANAAAAAIGPGVGYSAMEGIASVEQLTWSDDREHWWDGTAWVGVRERTPPMAQRSADGAYWWDGLAWREAVDTGESA